MMTLRKGVLPVPALLREGICTAQRHHSDTYTNERTSYSHGRPRWFCPQTGISGLDISDPRKRWECRDRQMIALSGPTRNRSSASHLTYVNQSYLRLARESRRFSRPRFTSRTSSVAHPTQSPCTTPYFFDPDVEVVKIAGHGPDVSIDMIFEVIDSISYHTK